MDRNNSIEYLSSISTFDICIIGGGATGLGIALDATSRGLKTILLEKYDFAKGTSSRSTKLIHGGVRYLEQGNIKLVMDALRERGILKKNAPHLVKSQAFIIPTYNWWQKFYYGFGLKIYDLLSGSLSFGDTQILSKKDTQSLLPTLENKNLKGGVLYFDGQFDDSRLAIHLAMTASEHGACMLNYFSVDSLIKENEKICGVVATDTFTNVKYTIKSQVVINATGVFSDSITRMDNVKNESMISPSQGIHLVLDKSFLPSEHAIMIPKTKDSRVLFAVPWHEYVIVGTTDTPIETVSEEPKPLKEEIDFILEHATHYLNKKPTYIDVKSVFTGLRPLVKSKNKITSAISRDHQITISTSGLISVIGGKWTTYRKIAEDALKFIGKKFDINIGTCKTQDLKIFEYSNSTNINSPKLHSKFDYTEQDIINAVKHEMCMTVEDALARRTRMLFLDVKAAVETAALVAKIMAKEMGRDEIWVKEQVEKFDLVSKNFKINS